VHEVVGGGFVKSFGLSSILHGRLHVLTHRVVTLERAEGQGATRREMVPDTF
jgi:hypothetical protein